MAVKTERNVKVYLRDHYRGEVSAVHTEQESYKEQDPETGKEVSKVRDISSVNILKVFPEVHEPTGNILAFFTLATPSERDNLWAAGMACDRYAAMGLVAPEAERGKVPPLYDDPIPEHHKIAKDLHIVEDDTVEEEEAFEDEFVLDDEEVIIGRPHEPIQEIPVAPNVLIPPEEKNPKLEDIISIGPPVKASLKRAGLKTVKDAVNKSVGDFEKIPGIGKTTAQKLFNALKDFRTKK